nr:carbohydrate sulfotransferase 11-like [Lytechinus pictus]
MPVPFIRMCTTRCKRLYTLIVMIITAFLVLYAIVSLGGNDEKSDNLADVVKTRSEGAPIERQEILEKVKEVIEEDIKGTQQTEDDGAELNDKLFDNTEEEEDERPQEIIGCDACGEIIEDVALPLEMTTRRIVAEQFITEGFINENDTQSIGMNQTLRVLTPEEKTLRRQERENRTLARESDKRMREALRIETKNNKTIARIAERRRQEALFNLTRAQSKRKFRMENACSKSVYLKYQNLLYKDTLRHLFVVDSQKLMFCYIPKVGCSNWKRILMVLSGKKNSMDSITSREAHSRNGLTRFGSLSMAEQFYRLKNYRKVMFVREPFTRIISAFKNKYKDLSVFRQAPEYLKQFARRIMRKYRPGASPRELTTGENITWAEFTDYLADPLESPNFDEHWKESYKLCSPCKIKYDFIGKLENIENEANYVLQHSNFTMNLTYPSPSNSHPTNSASLNISYLFEDFSKEKLQALWDIYRIDYALFDYEKPSFVP